MDSLRGSLTPHATMRGVLGGREQLRGGLGIGGGTTDYEELENKPAINGVELIGDQSGHDLGLALLTDIPQTIDYSFTEQNTGVKWVDGKDIFVKSVNLTSFSGTTNIISDVDTLIQIYGTLTDGSNQWSAPYNDGDYAMFAKNPSNIVRLILSSWFINNISSAIITVKYTKI